MLARDDRCLRRARCDHPSADDAGIEYALCGALALAAHGAPRPTNDIDVIARKEDASRIRDVARRTGFVFEALPMEFAGSGIEVQRFSKLIDGRPLMLDVLKLNPERRSQRPTQHE